MKRVTLYRASFCGALVAVLFSGSVNADWRQFRGPGYNGASDLEGLPVAWESDGELVR